MFSDSAESKCEDPSYQEVDMKLLAMGAEEVDWSCGEASLVR